MLGLFVGENPSDLKEHCASGLIKSGSLASNAESLARKPSGKKVVGWDVSVGDSCNVSCVNLASEVFIIRLRGVLVPFAGKYTKWLCCHLLMLNVGAIFVRPPLNFPLL